MEIINYYLIYCVGVVFKDKNLVTIKKVKTVVNKFESFDVFQKLYTIVRKIMKLYNKMFQPALNKLLSK